MVGEEFRWGKPACHGLAVGIAIDKNMPKETIEYRIAFANQATSPKQITLFSMLPGLFRVRVIGRQGAIEEAAPAINDDKPVSNHSIQITENLAPGQVVQRRGAPATFPGRLTGKGTRHMVLGLLNSPNVNVSLPDDSNQWCRVKSGEVEVEFYPIAKE